MKVYQKLAIGVELLKSLKETKPETCYRHRTTKISEARDELQQFIEKYLPTGSGIDDDITIRDDNPSFMKDGKIRLSSSFHVMDENGFYDGWIDFIVEIIPCLTSNFRLRIIGNFSKRQGCIKKDASDIRDYLYSLFYESLNQEIPVFTDLQVCEQLDFMPAETIRTCTSIGGVVTLILENGRTATFTGLKGVN